MPRARTPLPGAAVRFEASIDAFSAALVAPEAPPPAQTLGRVGRPDVKRFSVYRNNVAVGLIASLEARFPVTLRLVGAEFFRAMARAYFAAEKPRDAMLIRYGARFPDFAEAFEPARALAYLPDVARLENAWVESYHAAEAPALTLAELAGFPAERLAEARVSFHPSARLLRSSFPAASIWAAHRVWVMPGGLTRVSTSLDSMVVSIQRGGGSKDTWVLSKWARALPSRCCGRPRIP